MDPSFSVADIVDKAAPSVVGLEVSVLGRRAVPHLTEGKSITGRQFFRVEPRFESVESKVGDGSGFIISPEGHIVTNYHVINPTINGRRAVASKIEAVLFDGRKFPVKVIGEDEASDIAVIQVETKGLRPIAWGNSMVVRPGDFAITIGSSLGADNTVGFGIISGVSRKQPGGSLEARLGDLDYIQTYAQINPGNSGGPLINAEGEVIGITSFIQQAPHSPGFAIPSNYAKPLVETLLKDGKVRRPAVGISITSLIGSSGMAEKVLVQELLAGGPSAKAGIRVGDLILAVNDKLCTASEQFTHEIRTKPVGSVFALDLQRGRERLSLTVRSEYLD